MERVPKAPPPAAPPAEARSPGPRIAVREDDASSYVYFPTLDMSLIQDSQEVLRGNCLTVTFQACKHGSQEVEKFALPGRRCFCDRQTYHARGWESSDTTCSFVVSVAQAIGAIAMRVRMPIGVVAVYISGSSSDEPICPTDHVPHPDTGMLLRYRVVDDALAYHVRYRMPQVGDWVSMRGPFPRTSSEPYEPVFFRRPVLCGERDPLEFAQIPAWQEVIQILEVYASSSRIMVSFKYTGERVWVDAYKKETWFICPVYPSAKTRP